MENWSKIVFLVIATLVANTVEGSVPFLVKGDSLYVWAEGGLNMRSTGSLESDKIIEIPYGAIVVFENYEESRKTEQVEFFSKSDKVSVENGISFTCETYKQKGRWYKVKYEDLTGYVFSGFLSRYKPSKEEGSYSIDQYIDNHFKKELEKEKSHFDYIVNSKFYEYGISVITKSEKSSSSKYTFPNMTLEESILLLRKVIRVESLDEKICLNELFENPSKGLKILYFTNNTNWSLEIASFRGTIVVTVSRWC